MKLRIFGGIIILATVIGSLTVPVTPAQAFWRLPGWFTPSGNYHTYPQANCDKGWFKRRGDCWRRIY